jgi:hypothetical protein
MLRNQKGRMAYTEQQQNTLRRVFNNPPIVATSIRKSFDVFQRVFVFGDCPMFFKQKLFGHSIITSSFFPRPYGHLKTHQARANHHHQHFRILVEKVGLDPEIEENSKQENSSFPMSPCAIHHYYSQASRS